MKKKSLNTFFDVIPKSKIPHSLMLYPFFDVIPKSKIPSVHMKKTETTDLKWIGGREVGLRRIGGVGLRLISDLGRLVGRWCHASWRRRWRWVGPAAINREVRVWESELERWKLELERWELELEFQMRAWEWHRESTVRIKESKKINQVILF